MKMPLPLGRARAFEAAGTQTVLARLGAASAGLVSSADRVYMEALVPRLLSVNYISYIRKNDARFLLH